STNVKVQQLHVATSNFKLQQPPTKLFLFKGRPRSAFLGQHHEQGTCIANGFSKASHGQQ
ncbi:hypothetical protein ACLOJK_023968, partial [Asimina triloba]